ncbi:MAG: hypothetical protein ABI587_04800 [Gemmatimonadales bacterium]
MRELLFGDVPLAQWAGSSTAEPWTSFGRAVAALARQDAAGARQALKDVLAQPELEPRHYLEAWEGLRGLDVLPPAAEAKEVYGVVLDVSLDEGVDTLAAYADRTARYINYSGNIIVWDHPNFSLDRFTDALLDAGRALVTKIGPYEHARPPLPAGATRISLLTPGGIHFGQAPFDVLAQDPLGSGVITSGAALMEQLINTGGG